MKDLNQELSSPLHSSWKLCRRGGRQDAESVKWEEGCKTLFTRPLQIWRYMYIDQCGRPKLTDWSNKAESQMFLAKLWLG